MRQFTFTLTFALMVGTSHAACPGGAAPGNFCAGVVETACPVGAYCTGGAAASVLCFPATACSVGGLSVQPPCYWSVTTLAGNRSAMFANGQGTTATFSWPVGIAIAISGVVYVADNGNQRIRAVSPLGVVSTFAGNGSCAFTGGLGTAAGFCGPWGIAVHAASGNLLIADIGNHAIRVVSPTGFVSTIAGNGLSGWADGAGTSAIFNGPRGVASDNAGVIYVADTWNNCIRTITPLGQVATLSVSGGGFYFPHGVATDGAGRLFVGDTYNEVVRVVFLSNGTMTSFAGQTGGWADGIGTGAAFNKPMQINFDGNGNLLVADQSNARIRMITPQRVVTTLAGNGAASYWDDYGTAALMFGPSGVAANSAGVVYVADTTNACIRQLTCVPCPAAFYCSSGAPVLCPAGSYCPLSSVAPTNCPGGTYSAAVGASSASTCLPCPCPAACTSSGLSAAPSCSLTRSRTSSTTRSRTVSTSGTPSLTSSLTKTVTPSRSGTATISGTRSRTSSPTGTTTPSYTRTSSPTQSLSSGASPSGSSTVTATRSCTASGTATRTGVGLQCDAGLNAAGATCYVLVNHLLIGGASTILGSLVVETAGSLTCSSLTCELVAADDLVVRGAVAAGGTTSRLSLSARNVTIFGALSSSAYLGDVFINATSVTIGGIVAGSSLTVNATSAVVLTGALNTAGRGFSSAGPGRGGDAPGGCVPSDCACSAGGGRRWPWGGWRLGAAVFQPQHVQRRLGGNLRQLPCTSDVWLRGRCVLERKPWFAKLRLRARCT